MASSASYEQDSDGTKFIPASQRPDGSWRKPRRVKDGYVPQEEVPLYESKGKQFASRRTNCPVGLTSEILAEMKAQALKEKSREASRNHSTAALQSAEVKSTKKKKKKSAAENIVESLAKTSLNSLSNLPSKGSSNNATSSPNLSADPGRRLKSLKKKLREIEILEQKISAGELPKPDKDQVEKLSKKQELVMEISNLELLIEAV